VAPITTPVPWSTKKPGPIDAGPRLCDRREATRDQRRAEFVQRVGEAVHHDRGEARIAQQDLVAARRRRIAVVGGGEVLEQHRLDRRQPLHEALRDRLRQRLQAVAGARAAAQQVAADLFLQHRHGAEQRVGDERVDAAFERRRAAAMPAEQHRAQAMRDRFEIGARRQRAGGGRQRVLTAAQRRGDVLGQRGVGGAHEAPPAASRSANSAVDR
jgi:hypothetical protein